jgi:8-oxo-dGTP pyrophosphatase MutT (NUDIX family)
MISAPDAIRLVEGFDPAPEEQKSHELILALLEQTEAPFSRHQFNPGHITCSSVVFDPGRRRVLLMYHHRFRRWLLAGGHVEETDATLADTASRETTEETTVRIARTIGLVGLDVHGIPARKGKREPFHLHHDLIFAFEAESKAIAATDEAPQVVWCQTDELSQYNLPANVARALVRAFTLV